MRDQLAACVRRAIARGDLSVGDRLPPAAELAETVAVDRNTVLAAYRQLRDASALEFRRGRGVRVAAAAPRQPAVVQMATQLIDGGRAHGLGRADLIHLIEEMT